MSKIDPKEAVEQLKALRAICTREYGSGGQGVDAITAGIEAIEGMVKNDDPRWIVTNVYYRRGGKETGFSRVFDTWGEEPEFQVPLPVGRALKKLPDFADGNPRKTKP